MGITVSPVRVKTIDQFGSLETVGQKLLDSEKAKVRQECSGEGRWGLNGWGRITVAGFKGGLVMYSLGAGKRGIRATGQGEGQGEAGGQSQGLVVFGWGGGREEGKGKIAILGVGRQGWEWTGWGLGRWEQELDRECEGWQGGFGEGRSAVARAGRGFPRDGQWQWLRKGGQELLDSDKAKVRQYCSGQGR